MPVSFNNYFVTSGAAIRSCVAQCIHTMKRAISTASFLIIFFNLSAQAPYNRALGIKFPGGLSLTYKKFVSDQNNAEALLTIANKGFRLTGLYEFNFYSFQKIPNLSWFVGPGAHIGLWKAEFEKDYGSKTDLGVDGILGLDYKFNNIPLNVSVDWQPSVTLVGSAGFAPAYGGVGVRYTF